MSFTDPIQKRCFGILRNQYPSLQISDLACAVNYHHLGCGYGDFNREILKFDHSACEKLTRVEKKATTRRTKPRHRTRKRHPDRGSETRFLRKLPAERVG
jgi:hypothetical protein